jgi:RND family efflux transporter MFP subunit
MAIIVAALLLTGCDRKQSEATVSTQHVPVRVTAVAAAAPVGSTPYAGNVTPHTQVEVAFKVDGYVAEITQVDGSDGRPRPLQSGDPLTKDAELAKVRDEEYRDQLQKAQANQRKAEADLQKATQDYDRAKHLQATRSITGPDFDSAQQEFQSAQAAVSGAGAQVDEAKLNLDYTTLKSPLDGVVLSRQIEVGTLVRPGTVAFDVADMSAVKVVFSVPDTMVSSIHLGDTLDVSTESIPGKRLPGHVTRVAPVADEQTRAFEVEVTVPNPDGALKDGMVAKLDVPTPGRSTALLSVPLTAVVRGADESNGYAVFVVEGQGEQARAKLRPVALGDVEGNSIQVVSGVRKGDRVMVVGATLIKDGDPVRIAP